MSKLNYKRNEKIADKISNYEENYQSIGTYEVTSMYESDLLKADFLDLKTNIVDFNRSLVTKCVQGTENDFKKLMDKASEYLNIGNRLSEGNKFIILKLFQQCVFGFYILTPLIEEEEVSDIKVLDYDHIVIKANGDRYLTDVKFYSEEDYRTWFERILRIHRLGRGEEFSLNHCTDRKGVEEFYLRIDVQLPYITSTERANIHIRKMPKEKLSWEYLKENGMLTDEHMDYIKDRILAGYGFLISGRGGSGKSTLLNNMLDWIPFDQSILVSQESDELYSNVHPQMQFEHTMTVRKGNVVTDFSLEDELRLGLLQDIDNFVIGEIKGGEALHVFTTAMSTGARFFGTIHSNDAISSVRRLAQCARYVSDYPMETLEEMLSIMPFTLIHMSHFSIDEIVEIDGWDAKNKRLIYRKVYEKER